ncbi:MAG TPA: pitrilysin family protein, partial [Limnochordia bacterium]
MAQGDSPFRRTELAAGVTAYVQPTERFKTIACKVFLRRPLTAETVTPTALLPLVLRRGTARLPSQLEIARHLENLYGASFSADVIKIGEVQAVECYLEFASDRFLPGQTRLLGDAIRFLSEVLLEPVLDGGCLRAEYVAQEKEALRRKIEALINDKRTFAVFRCFQEMCAGEPYSLHRYGRVDDLAAITPATLTAHYRRMIQESPIDIFVVGAVDPDDVCAALKDAFGFSRSIAPLPPPATRRAPRPARTVIEEEDVKQGVLVLGYRLPVSYADDAYPALLLYNGVLGGFPSSKLFVNVREKASLAYFAYSRLEPTKGVQYLSAGIDVAKYDAAREIIERQVA